MGMANCVHCGGPIYGDGIVCFRCKGLGAKREIYDSEKGPRDPGSFSDLYLGNTNYKKMRKKNIRGDS
ncbi:MAG TPA: hypothetical protein VD736_01860 [Nitrososphaera sp.]|nr:hypothetical protein [Nitrososphaera sp.]